MLISNPENIASNSYISVDEAEEYFNRRLHTNSWASLADDDKPKALLWASILITRGYVWKGYKKNYKSYLSFPRYGLYDRDGYYVDDSIYPPEIQEGTCELALAVIEEDIVTSTGLDRGLIEIKLAQMSLKFDKDKAASDSFSQGLTISNKITTIFSVFIDSISSSSTGTIEVVRT